MTAGLLSEYNSGVWRPMPRRLMAKLQNPRWGKGTVKLAYWTFTDMVPLLSTAVRAAGGELQMEDGGLLRFGRPKKFLHKIYRSPRR